VDSSRSSSPASRGVMQAVRRLAIVFAVGILGSAMSAHTASAAPDPLTCSGYPEPRAFVESQSWWDEADLLVAGGQQQHVHAGACMPLNQVVDGQVEIDVVTKFHHEVDKRLALVRIDVCTDQGGCSRISKSPNTVCTTKDCTWTTGLTWDTSGLAAGRYELRVAAESRPVGADLPRNLATSGWLVCVRSCFGHTPQATDVHEARGWYQRAGDSSALGYLNARFDSMSEFPWQGRFIPVSGIWRPPVHSLDGDGAVENDGFMATIDPDFHAGNPGRVVYNAVAALPNVDPRLRLLIDTTRLADGRHKLALITRGNTGFLGQLSGVFVIPFEVNNGGSIPPLNGGSTSPPPPPPPPPPDPTPTASVEVTGLVEGATVSGRVRLNARTTGDVTRVDYLIDGQRVAYDGTAKNGWGENWNATAGSHVLVARGTTSGGHSVESAAVHFSAN
jgi:hypothetical protein